MMDTENSLRGLDPAEIPILQLKYGKNIIPPIRGPGAFRRFISQFTEPLVAILVLSAILAALLGHGVDAAVIGGVVVLNAVIGFLQEAKALKALAALSAAMKTRAMVWRGGVKTEIDSSELVPGDVIVLESGLKVPADAEILSARDLLIDESNLTGESVPVAKKALLDQAKETVHSLEGKTQVGKEPAFFGRDHICFASTLVVGGSATCLVRNIGIETEMGRISQAIEKADSLSTPLTLELAKLSYLMLKVILLLALATMCIGLWRGLAFVEVLLAAVALAVGAIPEGLPAAVTITLAIGVARMAKRNAIIRKLPAVETLGCTTVICSDKTGTLTQNKMSVQHVLTHSGLYSLNDCPSAGKLGRRSLPGTEFNADCKVEHLAGEDAAFKETVVCGFLCNNAFQDDADGTGYADPNSGASEWRGEKTQSLKGDPTETALLAVRHPSLPNCAEVRAAFPRVDELVFTSETHYMATLHEQQPDQAHSSASRMISVKGSSEKIIERCSSYLDRGGELRPLGEGEKEKLLQQAEAFAAGGHRVLAFARGSMGFAEALPLRHEHVRANLVFLGFQALIDPPRPEVAVAIERCRKAGIAVKMITGDHPLTALAIARDLGVGDGSATDLRAIGALTGSELAGMDPAELRAAVQNFSVFARVTPEQKIGLVRALQELGQVVAMTGDGVNDGPALRQANIGVAMGRSGTEVAREAADMILTDDHFATIVAAVEEGRGVFDNLQKFIVWTLPTNLAEGLVILLAIAAGKVLPILPVQVLWINMTTAVCLGLTLAFEPKQPDLMQREPRPVKFSLLPRSLIMRIGTIGLLILGCAFGLFEIGLRQGLTVSQARTLAINVFVSIEIFYLFNCRALSGTIFKISWSSNRTAWAGILLMIALQLLFNYAPFMNVLFQTAAHPAEYWFVVVFLGFCCMILIELEKLVVARLHFSVKK